MHIAFLATEFITEEEFYGGLANYLNRITQILVSRGHHVEVFTLSNQESTLYYDGVLVHQIEGKSRLFDFLSRITRYKLKRTFRFLSLSHCLKKRLLRRHSHQQFDVIQASSCFACGLFLTFKPPLPIVTRVSSFEPLFRAFYRKPLNFDQRVCEWLELLAIKRSSAAYAPSRFLARILKDEKGMDIDVLYPPFLLETNRFDESVYKQHLAGKKYFLFYGAIGFLKGGEVLAEVLPVLLTRFPEMYFVLIGKVHEGPRGLNMLEHILQRAESCRDRILYLGILRHPQLYPIIRHSKGVVLPSLIDNFPNTMLESMALGKVVIGTKRTSFEELIDDEVSGVLVEPDNAGALLKAMERVWCMDEKEMEKMGAAAKRQVARLAPEKTCSELERYLAGVAANSRGNHLP